MIADADKMSVGAANSLLKFLEEPSADTVAILMTEQVQRILADHFIKMPSDYRLLPFSGEC